MFLFGFGVYDGYNGSSTQALVAVEADSKEAATELGMRWARATLTEPELKRFEAIAASTPGYTTTLVTEEIPFFRG